LACEGAVRVLNDCANERTNVETKRAGHSRRSILKVMRWGFEFAQGTPVSREDGEHARTTRKALLMNVLRKVGGRRRVKSVMIAICYYYSPRQSHI